MSIYNSASNLIGNTPIMKLCKYSKRNNISSNILAKLEGFNLTGSVKDRVAKYMIEDAEEKGQINKDTVIIEPTSGNTGIGLSAFAAEKGYKIILTMPESMSIERRKFLKAYGAEIVLTNAETGMSGAIEKANELHKNLENSFIPSQFTNKASAEAHFKTTGPEIWKDTNGDVDIFISAVGSGGTITGTGNYLKQKNPNIKVIAVEPLGSPVLSKGFAGKHAIQGIGAGFIPDVLDTSVYDEVIAVSDDDAMKTAAEIVQSEGLFVGISSGAAVFAAKILSERAENRDKNIVVILPDRGNRYLSTPGFIKYE